MQTVFPFKNNVIGSLNNNVNGTEGSNAQDAAQVDALWVRKMGRVIIIGLGMNIA